MMKGKWKQAISLTLAAFALFSAMVLVEAGPQTIGKSYTETEDFQSGMRFFYNTVGPFELNPLDPEQAKKEIRVSAEEIEDHRYRYGNLEDQLASIRDQYEGKIEAAESTGEKEKLTAERDEKLEDIRQNFLDDKHVAEKVREEKGKAIDAYLERVEEERPSFESYTKHISYELTDTATGETFKKGNVNEQAAYKRTFNSKNGYLRTDRIAGDTDYSGEIGTMISNEVKTYEGTVIVSEAVVKGAPDQGDFDAVYEYGDNGIMGYTQFREKQIVYSIIWIAGIAAMILLFTVFKFEPAVWAGGPLADRYNRLPVDVAMVTAGVVALIMLIDLESLKWRIMNSVGSDVYYWLPETIAMALLYVAALGVLIWMVINLYHRMSSEERRKRDFERAYIRKVRDDVRTFFLNKKIGTQVLMLLVVIFLAGLGFGGVLLMPWLIMIWLPLFLFIALPVMLFMIRKTGYLNRIIDATGQMAAGRYTESIPVKGTSPFARHAADLNRLREGVQLSMSEQARSERLKTELITNVSHDLRTPLTSIITYTDLLKNQELSDEERAEYVDVLDRKSQRLKTLIDDLFDVSKMATGNIELNRQRVDLGELVRQAIAEHGEEMAASPLDFRVNIADLPLPASVDGQKWWRMIDNLIQNALKYALPGTRVYISLEEAEEGIRFTIKNISRYELGDSADDLFERFKRGDASRHTEGSGLGLAIAQSIVDLHGGRMAIDLDGDLFKVTVTVPKA